MSFTSTHTYAELAVSTRTYEEVARLLMEANYTHAFIKEGAKEVIDMAGIGLVKKTPDVIGFPEAEGERIAEAANPRFSVPDALAKLGDIYRERNAIYGDNYKHFGRAMRHIFPNGLNVQSAEDWNRIGIFIQVMAKITRYGAAFANGGHADSLDDMAVYAQMLRELDHEASR